MDVAARIQPSILIVGNAQHLDFAAVCTFLRNVASLHYFDATSPSQRQVDVIVAFQTRPGELAQEVIERAYRSNPMATILAILGSWCEGEMRSGRPWHGVERVYWYDAVARLTTLLQGNHVSIGYRTHTAAEQIERSLPSLSCHPCHEEAAILGLSRTTHATWQEVLSKLGYLAKGYRSVDAIATPADLIFWDANDLGDSKLVQEIEQAKTRFPYARLMTALSFPRRNEVDTLKAIGVLVLGKPLLLADLTAALQKSALPTCSAVA